MVNRQQQPLVAVGQGGEYCAQQRPLGQVKAALGALAHGLQGRNIGHGLVPEARRLLRNLPIPARPTAVIGLGEAQAQGIVVGDQGQQRLFQQLPVQRLDRTQQ